MFLLVFLQLLLAVPNEQPKFLSKTVMTVPVRHNVKMTFSPKVNNYDNLTLDYRIKFKITSSLSLVVRSQANIFTNQYVTSVGVSYKFKRRRKTISKDI